MSRPLARPTGFPVLVAAPPIARPTTGCVIGELCWLPPICANHGLRCDCRSAFVGAASGGRTALARVQVMRGVERRSVLRALRDAASPLVGPVVAAGVAARTLDAASAFRPGTFLVRDEGSVRPAFRLEHQHQHWSADGTDGERHDGGTR